MQLQVCDHSGINNWLRGTDFENRKWIQVPCKCNVEVLCHFCVTRRWWGWIHHKCEIHVSYLSVAQSVIQLLVWLNFFTARPHYEHIAVLARGILYVKILYVHSVCMSVTFRCFVQTNENTIVRFSASGWTILVVTEEVQFIQIFVGDRPHLPTHIN